MSGASKCDYRTSTVGDAERARFALLPEFNVTILLLRVVKVMLLLLSTKLIFLLLLLILSLLVLL